MAWLRHQQIFARPDYKREAQGFAEGEAIIDDDALELGQLYRSNAVLGAGAELPVALPPDEWAGQPGTRAQHLWVMRDGQKISTLDLFGSGWVLLTQDARWNAAAERASAALGVQVASVAVSSDVVFDDATGRPHRVQIARADSRPQRYACRRLAAADSQRRSARRSRSKPPLSVSTPATVRIIVPPK